jgi:SAC3/GANP family
MIRKDFILQNFVGTGGACDARAVRCHERIARWHAMCEHQLSHIPDYVVAQSQQNIQELGQTMKTLNMYYDDSLNRSTVEVPDNQGKETNAESYDCGCKSDTVQGPDPIDYTGETLANKHESTGAKRCIGKVAQSHSQRGTAQAEMRGLYILLTIDNDGGMEVIKYASRLFTKRPDIYYSPHVQLALEIYKVL